MADNQLESMQDMIKQAFQQAVGETLTTYSKLLELAKILNHNFLVDIKYNIRC